MTLLSNRNMKNRRYRGQALLVVLLGALTLSGCAVAPAGDLENFEPISLGDNPAPAPTKTFDPEGQEYANDPSAEVDIEDQSGDGLLKPPFIRNARVGARIASMPSTSTASRLRSSLRSLNDPRTTTESVFLFTRLFCRRDLPPCWERGECEKTLICS